MILYFMGEMGSLKRKGPFTVSLMMCKGGVGKTTTSLLLSLHLYEMGHRVLCIDLDPQGNLTSTLTGQFRVRHKIDESTAVLYDWLAQEQRAADVLLHLDSNLSLVPSSSINSLLDRALIEQANQSSRSDQSRQSGHPLNKVAEFIAHVGTSYDFVIVDSAPSLNIVNASVMCASDLVLLPVLLDEYSRLGILQTLSEIRDLRAQHQIRARARILINKMNISSRVAHHYLGLLADEFKPLMTNTIVRECDELSLVIAEMRNHFSTARTSREDFQQLSQEIVSLVGSPQERYADLR
jgi:chromosome partitioning protein